MAQKSFAENIAKSQLLVKALQAKADNLPAGISKEMVQELEQIREEAVNLNADQERLKAQLKEKTTSVEANIKKLEEKYAVLKKYVKLGISQTLWREFGIEDKR